MAPADADLLDTLGIPLLKRTFRFRLDPSRIPKPETIWPYLLPSVLAGSFDDRGFRLISREAFPLACIPKGTFLNLSIEPPDEKGLNGMWKVLLGVGDP
jgi:hypothetical protein